MNNDQVLTVMSDEFRAFYDLYEDYDDMVIHKLSKQIFKLNFINGIAQLVPVSNEAAITCKFHSKFPAVSQTCFHFFNSESGCKIVA